MRGFLVVVLLTVSVTAAAQTAPTDAGQSFSQFAADTLKQGRGVVMLSPYFKPAYAAYVPVWTFHAAYDMDAAGKPIRDPYRQFFSVGGGGKYDLDTKSGSGFIGCDINIVALSARLWDFAWARNHVDRVKFPPVYGGGSFIAPTSYEGIRTMNLKRDFRVTAGIGYPITALQTSSPNTP